MYRWVDLWPAVENMNFNPILPSNPTGLPDAACNADMFVFVHGYNMAYSESVAWAGEFFKRLRQSGSSTRFAAVAWRGNYSQWWYPGIGLATLNYYWNVHNAFMTSLPLKRAVEGLPGHKKYIAAHSLGNMLVSAAIADWQMPYSRYFMLNAAVAMEAYTTNAITSTSHDCMTPPSWSEYPDRVRATHWHELFSSEDPRRTLTWRNRFGDIPNALNYYSTEEEVLANGDGTIKRLARTYVWYNQETRKGTWLTSPMSEAGWGFNRAYDVERHRTQMDHGTPEDITYYDRRTPEETASLSFGQLRTTPFFGHFDNRDVYSAPVNTVDYKFRAAALGRGIPVESFAAGANAITGWEENVRSFNQAIIGKDPANVTFVSHDEDLENALHTFFIVSPYYYNHRLYESIINHEE